MVLENVNKQHKGLAHAGYPRSYWSQPRQLCLWHETDTPTFFLPASRIILKPERQLFFWNYIQVDWEY